MITVAGFGFTFYRIANLVNADPSIRMDVYLRAEEFEIFKSEILGSEDFLHTTRFKVKGFQNLRKGKFWKDQGVSADLYLLSDDAPLFAFPKRNSKSVFLPIGSDLTVQPFPMRAIKTSKTIVGKLKRFGIAIIQKHRIRLMDQVWATPFPVLANSLEKIRKDIELNKFVPFPINYQSHNQIPMLNPPTDILKGFESKFLVFFPGRLMATKSETDLLTGQTKGAEEALRGFLKFQESICSESLLLFVDNSFSPDKSRISQLIAELGAEHLVVWLTGSAPSNRLTNAEMASVYQGCEIVLGDFGSGWFGQTALESAAHGKSFISYIDPELMIQYFNSNPFVIAKTAEDICQCLMELHASETHRASKGLEMRKWYEDFLSEDVVRKWFQHEIRKALINEQGSGLK